jgi:pyruvate,water dikinase|tara:strand:- start:33110 stop:35431 length:2322 start_codon:yes stop_codon:yes gene_type:complete
MATIWLTDVSKSDIKIAGGKGASLGEMIRSGFPVPPGFVITASTYRNFINEAGIAEQLFDTVDVNVDDSDALVTAHSKAVALIQGASIPLSVQEDILLKFDELVQQIGEEDIFVAVRSSATAEDLPEASFAGQQETYLNVRRSDLLDRVKDCWASLFTQRAIYYRSEKGFSTEDVDISVVIQSMIDAESSGVLFTRHPSTGDLHMVIEAAWGLGEAVVSGEVSPDNYIIDRESKTILSLTISDKQILYERDQYTGETLKRNVSSDLREVQVLSESVLLDLTELGELIEGHYGSPQDIEWAIYNDKIYLLQSRPITTLDTSLTPGDPAPASIIDIEDQPPAPILAQSTTPILTGIGSSPGISSGPVRIITNLDHLDKVISGDILVTKMTTPDMVPAMKRAAGIITDEGGMTSHASIVSRELGVPAIVGAKFATTQLEDGNFVTMDGNLGIVLEGISHYATPSTANNLSSNIPFSKPMTATKVLVNISIPEAAERAASTGADGVGLLRIEHLILSTNKTPEKYIEDHGSKAYVEELIRGISVVADAFYPLPVRVRTLDAPTDEFRQLQGGEEEPQEHNPMLGYRGIRRSLDTPDLFSYELQAFAKLFDMGYDNIEIMFPLINDASDVYPAVRLMEEAGIDPDKCTWGVMIETPGSALMIEELLDTGIKFASFGTNDLTQYTLAVDRNNARVADRFDELHPAILKLISPVIHACNKRSIATSICGQAGSRPSMVRYLVSCGISSISANIDAVQDVQQEVQRVEQQLILDSIRSTNE